MITIYTDGSCKRNETDSPVGGWGAVMIHKDNRKEIYGSVEDTTNNRMELQACIEALRRIKRRDVSVELHTDSAYVCNCIKHEWYKKWRRNGWQNSKKNDVENQDLWKRLLELYESFDDLQFIKVKAHCGIELNEIADDLANRGSDELIARLDGEVS